VSGSDVDRTNVTPPDLTVRETGVRVSRTFKLQCTRRYVQYSIMSGYDHAAVVVKIINCSFECHAKSVVNLCYMYYAACQCGRPLSSLYVVWCRTKHYSKVVRFTGWQFWRASNATIAIAIPSAVLVDD